MADESVLELINRDRDKIVLNVGGIRHETLVTTLSSRPETRLGELAIRHLQNRADEYFFDRNPEVFDAILDYYRTGELHVPMNVCGSVFKRELEYWNLKETLIHPCCWVHYCTDVDKVEALDRLGTYSVLWREEAENEAMRSLKGWAWVRLATWRVMCRPNSSVFAKVYSVVSIMFVMASIAGCCLETVPSLQETEDTRLLISSCLRPNATNKHPFQRVFSQPIFALRILDCLCNTFFSVELVVRLIVAHRRLLFLRTPFSVVNIVALIPYYLMLLFSAMYHDPCKQENLATFLQIVFFIRMVRICRVCRMLACFRPLQILCRWLRDNVYELLMLFVFVVVGILIFATVAFYAEIDEKDSSFKTIPLGFWWAISTITRVAYGDVYPRTIAGYFVGSACALFGMLIFALTVSILSNGFVLYYTYARTRERAYIKEKERESEQFGESFADESIVVHNRKKD